MIEVTTTTEQSGRLAAIRDIAADVFSVEPDAVEAAASFKDDLEADSLLAIELLTQLEKHYDIAIADEEVPRMVNLAAVYEIVAENAGW
jgi:acyl carrier protein